MLSNDTIQNAVRGALPDVQGFLSDLVKIPSTSGREHDAMLFLYEKFSKLNVEVEKIAMSNALRDDPDYSDPVPDIEYDGRFNLRIVRKGTGGGKTMLFNTHTDVVPPSEGMDDPYSGRVENGLLYGRGACDAKGQIAAIYLVFKVLDALDVQLPGDVIAHIVNEEENGGNGTLAMARHGETADACIVCEPSDGKLFTSIRGAVWFRVVFTGKAGHSGQAGVTKSALLLARDAMAILEQYHADLLKSSRGLALFDPFPNPMPITFGKLNAGNWPAAAPSKATLEGVLGLLPNKTKEDVCREMKQALIEKGGDALANNFKLTFMYRHDSSVVEPEHELPQTILAAAKKTNIPVEVSAMTASCDAWLYNNQLGIPTVVYGPGTLAVAHSKDEQIKLSDIGDAANVLCNAVAKFCGAH